MIDLFIRCLDAEYIHTKESGDYAIEVEKNTIYVLFQCSEGLRDWINNFNFPKKPYKRMNDTWFCHRGFLKVWRAMKDDIECEIGNILQNSPHIKNIICVGYSHGGALSVLATEDLTYLYGSVCAVSGYGFGAPRVLWGRLPKALTGRLQRFYTIRNIPDLVTHLPPMIFGFRNAGNLVKIGEHFKYRPIKAHYREPYKTEIQIYTEGMKK